MGNHRDLTEFFLTITKTEKENHVGFFIVPNSKYVCFLDIINIMTPLSLHSMCANCIIIIFFPN